MRGLFQYFIFILLFLFLFSAQLVAEQVNLQVNVQADQSTPARSFPRVQPPTMLTGRDAQMNYVLQHYWDRFNFKDSSWLNSKNELNKAVLEYLSLFQMLGSDAKLSPEISKTLQKSAVLKPMQQFFVDSFSKYLSDPNSPLRNEHYYLEVLDFVIASGHSDLAAKERAKFDRNLLLKNRTGSVATNFNYTLAGGKSSALHQLSSEFTLLMFYNPDCDACAGVIRFLKNSSLINKLQTAKRLTILTVYPDKDLAAWQKHRASIPAGWINGYDKEQNLEREMLYDLKAIPTLYLLDRQKRVVLKDATPEAISAYLQAQ